MKINMRSVQYIHDEKDSKKIAEQLDGVGDGANTHLRVAQLLTQLEALPVRQDKDTGRDLRFWVYVSQDLQGHLHDIRVNIGHASPDYAYAMEIIYAYGSYQGNLERRVERYYGTSVYEASEPEGHKYRGSVTLRFEEVLKDILTLGDDCLAYYDAFQKRMKAIRAANPSAFPESL